MLVGKRLLVAFVVLVLVACVARLPRVEVGAVSEIHVSPAQSIQDAIDGAADGDTIVVDNGFHVEGQYPIVVNRSITLTGQDVSETVINGNYSNTGVLLVKADGVRVFNLTVQNTTGNLGVSGINLANVRFVEVADCLVANCGVGLMLTNSSENNVSRNVIVNNKSYGVYLHLGSSFNVISENNVTHNPTGIIVADTNCSYNMVYHNDFVANANQESNFSPSTGWDNGYPSGGNFWDDHTNEDLLSGVGQNVTGSDGIADVSYQGVDEYPLAEPVYVFFMYQWSQGEYYALISSNSTVYDFEFNPSAGSFLTFKTAGPYGTAACCRVVLSKSVLWVEGGGSWVVTVNGSAPASTLILEDANSAFFFFAYNQSTEVIRIAGNRVVPEYGLLAVLLLLVFSVSGLALFGKKGKISGWND